MLTKITIDGRPLANDTMSRFADHVRDRARRPRRLG
jgi:hypothetical protein